MATGARIVWHGKEVEMVVINQMKTRLDYIGALLERTIKLSMTKGTGSLYKKTSHGVKWSGSMGRSGGRSGRATTSKITHQASAPGQPPAVDTGRLRSSITWATSYGKGTTAKGDDGIKAPSGGGNDLVLAVGTNVDYGRYLEMGTRRMKARPFIRPAYNQNLGKINSILGKSFSGSVMAGGWTSSGRSGGWFS